MKAIKTFKQQASHPQADVSIHKGAIVSVDGTPTNTEREDALAYIILRLNATVNHLQQVIKDIK